MRIVCDKCDAKYVVPDEKIVRKTVRLTCRKCGNVITARVDDDVSENSTLGKWRQNTSLAPKRTNAETPGWYYSYNGESFGPYTQAELEAKVASPALQSIAEQCYVWHKTIETWHPLVEIEPFASAALKPPPAPPVPKKAPVSSGLPPLYSGHVSTGRSTASNQRVSPNVSVLKQRLMATASNGQEAEAKAEDRLDSELPTVTQDSPLLTGEAPTHQAMPMVEEIMVKAMTEEPVAEKPAQNKVGQSASKGAPLVSFQSLDAIAGVSSLTESGKREAVAKPFPSLSSIKPIERKPATDAASVAKPNAAAGSKPLLGGGLTGLSSLGKKPVGASNPLPQVGGASKPALGTGLGTLSGLKPKGVGSSLLGLGGLGKKPLAGLGGLASKADNAEDGEELAKEKKEIAAVTADAGAVAASGVGVAKADEGKASVAEAVAEPVGKQAEQPVQASDSKASSASTKDSLGDWLNSKDPFDVKQDAGGISLDGLLGDDAQKKANVSKPGFDFSLFEKASSPFSLDLGQDARKTSSEGTTGEAGISGILIDLDSNTSAEGMASIDLESSPAEAPLDSIDLDCIEADDSALAAISSTMNQAVSSRGLVDGAMDAQAEPELHSIDLDCIEDDEEPLAAVSSAMNQAVSSRGLVNGAMDAQAAHELDSIDLDCVDDTESGSADASESAQASMGIVDLDHSVTETPAAGAIGAIDLDASPSVQSIHAEDEATAAVSAESEKPEETAEQANVEESQELGGFAIDLDDEASSLISEDVVNEITGNALVADEEKAKRESSVARVRVSRLEELQKRQEELAAASAVIDSLDQPEENPDGPSERSMLIDFAHLAQLEKESKKKRNVKVIVAVATLVAIVLALAIVGGIKYSVEDDEEENTLSLGTASGRRIDNDDLSRQQHDEINLNLAGDEKTPRTTTRPRTNDKDNRDNTDTAKAPSTVESDNGLLMPGSSGDSGIIALPSKRADGHQAVVLDRPQEFGSTDNVAGSKYSGTVGKTASGEGPDRIEAGWKTVSPTVTACQRRLAKTGSLKLSGFYLNLQVDASGTVVKYNVDPSEGTEELVKCLDSKKGTWKFGEGEAVAVRKKFAN